MSHDGLSRWVERDGYGLVVVVIQTNGNDRARSDVSAPPLQAATPEILTDDEV
jgi:hypothetical protein